MKRKTVLLLFFAAFALLTFTGCETARGLVYEERVTESTGILPVDAVEIAGEYFDVATLAPGTYSPQQVIPAGTAVTIRSVELVPSRQVETGIGIVSGLLGPYGGLAGLLATAGLGIYSTVMNRRLSKSQRTEEALVKGIDVFRDVLDQTPQGEKIDQALTGALAKQQTALRVADHVRDLLRKYETPDKAPLVLS